MPSVPPCAMVLFGASGDLAKRKIIPAIYEMAREKLLPEKFVLVGYARSEMSDETQALCFLAGANSIFYGDRLLTTQNPDENHDLALFGRLGIRREAAQEQCDRRTAIA